MQVEKIPTFRMNLSPLSLGPKSKPNKKPPEAGRNIGWCFALF
jgi:hypothetical protein